MGPALPTLLLSATALLELPLCLKSKRTESSDEKNAAKYFQFLPYGFNCLQISSNLGRYAGATTADQLREAHRLLPWV